MIMNTNTVLPFTTTKRPRTKSSDAFASSADVIWPVAELPDERQCGEWLDRVIVGRPYEGTALSLWRSQPNLRQATEKLASFITPMWPAPHGGSLLEDAVERAVGRRRRRSIWARPSRGAWLACTSTACCASSTTSRS
jgi:hypothetical protein